jgi:nucleoside phosphorylase
MRITAANQKLRAPPNEASRWSRASAWKRRTFTMKGLELTLVAAIAATMLTSSAFAQASHRNDEMLSVDMRGRAIATAIARADPDPSALQDSCEDDGLPGQARQ